jgi:hypothetical protein
VSAEAVAQLRENQKQLDMDGIMVGVSRQALEEVLASHAALLAALKEIARQTSPEDMSVDQQLDADFEGACGLMIECARAALSKAGV